MAERTPQYGRAPAVDQPSQIRNVVLVGHSGAGKTTLTEAMLAATGTIQRAGRVDDGGTVTDYDEIEQRQHRSVNLALAPFQQDGVKVNLLDAPGYADFVGDLRAGLRAADAALFVVSAVDGIDGLTRMLWEECATVGMPRAVVITKIDQQRADFDAVVAECQEAFGAGVMPLYFPYETALVGLLTQRCRDYATGADCEPDDTLLERIADQRAELIEAIIEESEDESLMDR